MHILRHWVFVTLLLFLVPDGINVRVISLEDRPFETRFTLSLIGPRTPSEIFSVHDQFTFEVRANCLC